MNSSRMVEEREQWTNPGRGEFHCHLFSSFQTLNTFFCLTSHSARGMMRFPLTSEKLSWNYNLQVRLTGTCCVDVIIQAGNVDSNWGDLESLAPSHPVMSQRYNKGQLIKAATAALQWCNEPLPPVTGPAHLQRSLSSDWMRTIDCVENMDVVFQSEKWSQRQWFYLQCHQDPLGLLALIHT